MRRWVGFIDISRLGEPVFAAGDRYVRYNCPYCGSVGKLPDERYHLYVYQNTGLAVCFRCDAVGKVSKDGVYGELEATTPDRMAAAMDRFMGRNVVVEVRDQLPPDYHPIEPWMEAYTYLKGRGIEDSDIQYYRIGIGIEKLRGRIIFPDFEGETCVYYQARDYKGRDSKIKYLGPPRENLEGIDVDTLVYNLWRVQQCFGDVVITEGIISAIRAGRNAVATYGKGFTDRQVERLVNAGFRAYYVCFDGEARREAYDLAKRLMSVGGVTVKIVYLPSGEDPASISRDTFEGFLAAAEPFDPMMSMMRLL